jgi:hypothetical protein
MTSLFSMLPVDRGTKRRAESNTISTPDPSDPRRQQDPYEVADIDLRAVYARPTGSPPPPVPSSGPPLLDKDTYPSQIQRFQPVLYPEIIPFGLER